MQKFHDNGVSRKQVGLEISGAALASANTTFWPIVSQSETIGKVTSAIYSPRLEKNIALAMVASEYSGEGTQVQVQLRDSTMDATVVKKPFYDPNKAITKSG